jgi:hypothetical protein
MRKTSAAPKGEKLAISVAAERKPWEEGFTRKPRGTAPWYLELQNLELQPPLGLSSPDATSLNATSVTTPHSRQWKRRTFGKNQLATQRTKPGIAGSPTNNHPIPRSKVPPRDGVPEKTPAATRITRHHAPVTGKIHRSSIRPVLVRTTSFPSKGP